MSDKRPDDKRPDDKRPDDKCGEGKRIEGCGLRRDEHVDQNPEVDPSPFEHDFVEPEVSRNAEQQARTNYCRIIGHDWSVDQENGEQILRCSNRCAMDGTHKVVPR